MRLVLFLCCLVVESVTFAHTPSDFLSTTSFDYGRDHRLLGTKHKPQVEKNLEDQCLDSLNELPGDYNKEKITRACKKVKSFSNCQSVNGENIFHYDSISNRSDANRVLVVGVIHGDEAEGGSVARRWMERLVDLNARNSWRIIPIANPDGWRKKSRVNIRGVDLNRNFPSQDWDELAHKYWAEKKNKDPRRHPGGAGGSEPETQCLLHHLDEFKPDFVVSIHTPYGVLDFDGPKIKVPDYKWLPWVSLGTFPGSLGRYMWKDKQVPVLTVELRDATILEKMDDVDFLQDVAGTVAIKASRQTVTSFVNPSTKKSSNN